MDDVSRPGEGTSPEAPAEATPVVAPVAASPGRPRRWRWRWWLVAAAVPLGLVLVLVVAWAGDEMINGDRVARGVTVEGRDVGGLDESDLRAVVAGMASSFAQTPVAVTSPAGDLDLTAEELGVRIDVDATLGEALAIGGHEPLWHRPFDWAGGLVGERPAPVVYEINQTLVTHRLDPLVTASVVPPTEPTIEVTGDGWQVVPGVSGEVLETTDVVAILEAAVLAGDEVIEVALDPIPVDPRFTDTDAQALATEAGRLTDTPLTVTVQGTSAEATSDVLRTFYTPVVGDDALTLRLEPERVAAWLSQTFAGLRVEPTEAGFDLGFGVVVKPSAPGQACCTAEAPTLLAAALDAQAGRVELAVQVLEPQLTTEEAQSWGIREPVASFTTNHRCCEGRVSNIHRMADLMRGAVIPPGESLSLNEHVGERTREKGFVEAGAIYAGVFVEDVGGGVSQFATTTFNAAFFAGLEFDEYQAHTIYISRYPRGREATISWPSPDLEIHNPSPYGVLVWPTYTDSSITVTLWSTPWVRADQTGQSERSLGGGCTRVTTERTRWFQSPEEAERIRGGPPEPEADPLAVKDSVFAIYQPAEGVLC